MLLVRFSVPGFCAPHGAGSGPAGRRGKARMDMGRRAHYRFYTSEEKGDSIMGDDDPFGLEDEQPADDDKPEAENATIRQMREALERAEKRAQKAEQRGYDKAQKDLARKNKALEYAGALGNSKIGELFLKANPEGEVTEDTFKSFAEEYGLTKTEEPPEVPEPPKGPEVPEAAKFHGGSDITGSAGKISYDQYRQMVTAPGSHEEAIRLRQAGMVDDPVRQ